MIKPNIWIREIATGETFKAIHDGTRITYRNHEREGEIAAGELGEPFQIVDVDAERQDIERLLFAMIQMKSIQHGLYNFGLASVLVERQENERCSFQWFEQPINILDLL